MKFIYLLLIILVLLGSTVVYLCIRDREVGDSPSPVIVYRGAPVQEKEAQQAVSLVCELIQSMIAETRFTIEMENHFFGPAGGALGSELYRALGYQATSDGFVDTRRIPVKYSPLGEYLRLHHANLLPGFGGKEALRSIEVSATNQAYVFSLDSEGPEGQSFEGRPLASSIQGVKCAVLVTFYLRGENVGRPGKKEDYMVVQLYRFKESYVIDASSIYFENGKRAIDLFGFSQNADGSWSVSKDVLQGIELD